MTQTASFKNKFKAAFSLFKWELKSRMGILTVFSILAAVFITIILTFTIILNNVNSDSFVFPRMLLPSYYIEDDMGQKITAGYVFQIFSTYCVLLLNIIFTVVYTIKVFSYMHNKRKSDMFASLPMSRITMYFTRCATAFIFSVVPALFFMGIIAIISLCFGQPIEGEIWMVYVKLIVGSLACISAYGLVAICCGTTWNSVLIFITTCISYPIFAALVISIIRSFFLGFYSGFLNKSFFKIALNPFAAYSGENIVYWLVFTAICLFVGALLVKNRKFERAQSAFTIYLPCHIIKILLSFLIGTFLGVMFGAMNVLNYEYFGFIFGFLLGSIPTFVISHLIFYRGFDKLLKTSISLGVMVVTVIGFMAFCNYDPFGYNTIFTKLDDVQSAGYIDFSQCYSKDNDKIGIITKNCSEDFKDTESISNIVLGNKILLDEFNSNSKFENVFINLIYQSRYMDLNGQYCFSYKLKNGNTLTRIYADYGRFYYTDDLVKTMQQITFSDTYMKKYSILFNVEPSEISDFEVNIPISDTSAESYNINKTTKVGTENADKDRQTILEAFKKDFEADGGKNFQTVNNAVDVFYNDNEMYQSDLEKSPYSYDVYIYKKFDAVCKINISLYDDSPLYFGEYEEYYIPNSYTNTIDALEKIGIKSGSRIVSAYYDNY